MEVVSTDNLADQLRLIIDDKKLHLFHFATFLKAQN
jgi:hypothetical protein